MTAIPSALKNLQHALMGTRSAAERARLLAAITYVRRVYGLPTKPDLARDRDMKRRKLFVKSRHPFVKSTVIPGRDGIGQFVGKD